MFEVTASDGFARVGELNTKHGVLKTPVLFPVHNLGAEGGWNTPRYWEKFPHINTALFNAAFLSMNRGGHLGTILKTGVQPFVRFFGITFADSGGFIYKKYRLTIRPERILEIQEKMGADIASTLDFPIQCKALTENEKIARTVKNAKLALSLRKDPAMLLYASINGYDPIVLRNVIRNLKRYGDFDGYAIGSLMPRYSNYRSLVDFILAVKLEAGEKPVHVYGLGSPLVTHLLIYLGVDSFDSSFFVVASGNRNYSLPGYGRKEFRDLHDYSDSSPCNCPICQKHTLTELRKSRELLTFHNLWILWDEIEQTKTAIKENRVEEYLTYRFRNAKWAKKAFEYAKKRTKFYFPGA
ncbi:MAG: tRNA-guanine transglycosylase [Candidatus Bathyarchaeota archaeon]|nr:tRNA-guanine transglycosylase [Candidatus Bathyarchaeota archaeon]